MMILAATLLLLTAAAPPTPAAPSTDELIDRARAAVERLGTYRMRMVKDERLERGWTGEQVMELVVRERPFAVSARVVSGPAAGRRFLVDERESPGQLLVREAGLLGVMALWIDLESPLTRQDTRHPANQLGYDFVLRTLARDHRAARGVPRVDEGPDGAGGRCYLFSAPPRTTASPMSAAPPGRGAAAGYALKTRMCFDDASGLPSRVESWDARGLFERLRFELVASRVDEAFAPDGV